jgi:hypothetical protein
MPPARRTTGPSNENSAEQPPDLSQELVAANAEIERLQGLLANQTLDRDRLADVLQSLSQRLGQTKSPAAPIKSTKIPDPPILTDGKDPTFESWKLQIRGKLQVNANHFQSEEARMTYVFNRTGRDA